MRDHLYIVHHQIGDDTLTLPCVGEEELSAHTKMAQHLGVLLQVIDVDYELENLLFSCLREGLAKGWWKLGYD